MKTAFPKMKRIGKRTISLVLSVLIVCQIMDFSAISIGATEESENSSSQNEQAEPNNNENGETSNVETEPVEYEDWTVGSDYTLNEDKEVNNMTMNGGVLNLNGHSLTVHGNASVYGGTLYINKGYLYCSGNLSFSNYYTYLKMDNINDEIVVDGDFVWNRANAYNNIINNGVIKVGGDFRDDTIDGGYNFMSSEKNKVILNGSSEQHIIQKM